MRKSRCPATFLFCCLTSAQIEIAVEEGNNLGTPADPAGAEGCAGIAIGDAVFGCPEDRLLIIETVLRAVYIIRSVLRELGVLGILGIGQIDIGNLILGLLCQEGLRVQAVQRGHDVVVVDVIGGVVAGADVKIIAVITAVCFLVGTGRSVFNLRFRGWGPAAACGSASGRRSNRRLPSGWSQSRHRHCPASSPPAR